MTHWRCAQQHTTSITKYYKTTNNFQTLARARADESMPDPPPFGEKKKKKIDLKKKKKRKKKKDKRKIKAKKRKGNAGMVVCRSGAWAPYFPIPSNEPQYCIC